MNNALYRLNHYIHYIISGAKLLWQWLAATTLVTIATITGGFLALNDKDAAKLTEIGLHEYRSYLTFHIGMTAIVIAGSFLIYKILKKLDHCNRSSESRTEPH